MALLTVYAREEVAQRRVEHLQCNVLRVASSMSK